MVDFYNLKAQSFPSRSSSARQREILLFLENHKDAESHKQQQEEADDWTDHDPDQARIGWKIRTGHPSVYSSRTPDMQEPARWAGTPALRLGMKKWVIFVKEPFPAREVARTLRL